MGLSNKGTVNRAKKDLAGLAPTAEIQGESVLVTLGDVQCTIRAPLGDSLCTCPAPGMCRHRIAAILWLKRQTDQDAPAEEKPADLSPLLEVPVDQLRRAIGAKAFHALVFRLGRDGLPPIQEGSILQVELPWENAAVKLLLPLEHSACTCRSRELCRHKAAALLAYQLMKKRHTLEELAELEHLRWWRFHTLSGWQYGVPEHGNRDAEKKYHTCLRPYEDLEPEEKEKDRAVVRRVLHHVS